MANVHDSKVALGVLENVPRGHTLYSKRGLESTKLRSALQTRPTKAERIETYRQIAKTWVRVEHGFATIKHNMGCSLYRGTFFTQAQYKTVRCA